jgi:hypothetical protein
LKGHRHTLAQQIKRRGTLAACGLALAFMVTPAGSAAPADTAKVEIAHLLTFIGQSNCEFYRNATWYTAAQAQAHMDEKRALLSSRDNIRTAEEFIEKVATKSAFTGLPYRVRCAGGEAVAVSGWLGDELRHYRQQCASAAKQCVSRLARDTHDPA